MRDDLPPLPTHDELLARVGPHRAKWDVSPRPAHLEPAGEGEESVWDYPRPPAVRPTPQRVRVRLGETVVAESSRARQIIETAGAPVHYLPPQDVRTEWLHPAHTTFCEWKGAAVHFDLVIPGSAPVENAAFSFPDPLTDLGQGYETVAGSYAFYLGRLVGDLDGVPARPQPGGYYAGWVMPWIKGPIKGGPGSQGW